MYIPTKNTLGRESRLHPVIFAARTTGDRAQSVILFHDPLISAHRILRQWSPHLSRAGNVASVRTYTHTHTCIYIYIYIYISTRTGMAWRAAWFPKRSRLLPQHLLPFVRLRLRKSIPRPKQKRTVQISHHRESRYFDLGIIGTDRDGSSGQPMDTRCCWSVDCRWTREEIVPGTAPSSINTLALALRII